jgi:hypothetical protein
MFCVSCLVRSSYSTHIKLRTIITIKFSINVHEQGPDFDDMSSFFPCEMDDAIQNINLGYGAQAPKIIIL